MPEFKQYRITKLEDQEYIVQKRGGFWSFWARRSFIYSILALTSPLLAIAILALLLQNDFSLQYIYYQLRGIGWQLLGCYDSEEEAIDAIVLDKDKQTKSPESYYL